MVNFLISLVLVLIVVVAIAVSVQNRLKMEMLILKSSLHSLDEKKRKLDEMASAQEKPKVTAQQAQEPIKVVAPEQRVAAPVTVQAPLLPPTDVVKTEKTTSDSYEELLLAYETKKKSSGENWVGMNLINKIGAFFIIIGAIATAQYTGFPPWVRSVVLFLFAGGVVGLGEFLNRRKQSITSLGVSAAGVALLFVALGASYFGLHTLSMYPALFVCAGITGLGLFLAIRYEAQVVGAFALLGGYLPVFALNPYDKTIIYSVIVYFLVLNLLALVVAFRYKWLGMNILGLFLNVAGTFVVALYAEPVVSLVYAGISFAIYTILPVVSAYLTGEAFEDVDAILISVNIFIGSVIMFMLAGRLNIEHAGSILSILFVVFYGGLDQIIRLMGNDHSKNIRGIFSVSSIVSSVLFVLLAFEGKSSWIASLWTVEAVVLAIYGILRERKLSRICGFVLLIISGIALMFTIDAGDGFAITYSMFSWGMLLILGTYILKQLQGENIGNGYKIVALINFLLYMIYMVVKMGEFISSGVVIALLCVIATFLFDIAIKHIEIIKDEGTDILGLITGILGLLTLIIINGINMGAGEFLLNCLAQIIAMITMYDIINYLGSNKTDSIIQTICLSGYFLLIATQGLVVQANVSFNNAILSVLYTAIAFVWIIIGFMKNNSLVRHFGLGLSFIAVAKLLVIDTWRLSTGLRIISFILCGIMLMSISFVYQKFSNRKA